MLGQIGPVFAVWRGGEAQTPRSPQGVHSGLVGGAGGVVGLIHHHQGDRTVGEDGVHPVRGDRQGGHGGADEEGGRVIPIGLDDPDIRKILGPEARDRCLGLIEKFFTVGQKNHPLPFGKEVLHHQGERCGGLAGASSHYQHCTLDTVRPSFT